MKHLLNAQLVDRCHVVLVKKYLAKVSQGAADKDCFYIVNKREFKGMTYYQKFRSMTTNQTDTIF